MMKKRIVALLLVNVLLLGIPSVGLAKESSGPVQAISVAVKVAAGTAVEPRADVLVWKYQTTADGKLQKRRWNQTRGRWYDPAWITIGTIID